MVNGALRYSSDIVDHQDLGMFWPALPTSWSCILTGCGVAVANTTHAGHLQAEILSLQHLQQMMQHSNVLQAWGPLERRGQETLLQQRPVPGARATFSKVAWTLLALTPALRAAAQRTSIGACSSICRVHILNPES